MSAPVITSILPASGTAAGGGGDVLIAGTGLAGCTVTFGGIAATVTATTDVQITCTAPATQRAGAVDVVVTSASSATATSIGGYVYNPSITSIEPSAGAVGAGVSITGVGFLGCTVLFDTTTAGSIVINGDGTSITANAPSHANGEVFVYVRSGDGLGSASTPFTYATPAPVLGAITYDNLVGGTINAIGTNFQPDMTVRINGGVVTAAIDGNQFTTTMPDVGGLTSVSVSVETTGGTSTQVVIVHGPPKILSTNPSFSLPDGISSVIINGQYITIGVPPVVELPTVTLTADGGGTPITLEIFGPTIISAVAVRIPPLSPGGYIIIVSTTAGSSNGSPFTVTDTPPPAPPAIASIISNPALVGGTITVTGMNFRGAGAENPVVSINGTSVTPGSLTVNSFTAVVPSVHGLTSVSVSVETTGGLVIKPLGIAGPPVIATVSTPSGAIGTSVTLTGSYFAGAGSETPTVTVGGISATVSFLLDLSFTVPTGLAPGPTSIVVSTVAGGSSAPAAFTVTSTAALPIVTSTDPAGGPVTSGTVVKIYGSNFNDAGGNFSVTGVTFGGTGATVITSDPTYPTTDTSFSSYAPAGAPGAAAVIVTTTAGASNTDVNYTYSRTAPYIATISPSTGSTAGGNLVTFTGELLSNVTGVYFGSLVLVSANVIDANNITAAAPAGSPGPVTVYATGTAGDSNNVTYTYVVGPTITVLSPAAGPTAGGNTVTVLGSGFASVTGITVGGTPATSYIVYSDTKLDLTAPGPASAGPVPLVVSTATGTATATYTYTSAGTRNMQFGNASALPNSANSCQLAIGSAGLVRLGALIVVTAATAGYHAGTRLPAIPLITGAAAPSSGAGGCLLSNGRVAAPDWLQPPVVFDTSVTYSPAQTSLYVFITPETTLTLPPGLPGARGNILNGAIGNITLAGTIIDAGSVAGTIIDAGSVAVVSTVTVASRGKRSFISDGTNWYIVKGLFG